MSSGVKRTASEAAENGHEAGTSGAGSKKRSLTRSDSKRTNKRRKAVNLSFPCHFRICTAGADKQQRVAIGDDGRLGVVADGADGDAPLNQVFFVDKADDAGNDARVRVSVKCVGTGLYVGTQKSVLRAAFHKMFVDNLYEPAMFDVTAPSEPGDGDAVVLRNVDKFVGVQAAQGEADNAGGGGEARIGLSDDEALFVFHEVSEEEVQELQAKREQAHGDSGARAQGDERRVDGQAADAADAATDPAAAAAAAAAQNPARCALM